MGKIMDPRFFFSVFNLEKLLLNKSVFTKIIFFLMKNHWSWITLLTGSYIIKNTRRIIKQI